LCGFVGDVTGAPTPTQIRDAVFDLLRDPGYRVRAKKIGVSIAKTNALSTIARIADVIIAQNARHKTWRKDGQAYEFAQISETVISILASSSDGSEIS